MQNSRILGKQKVAVRKPRKEHWLIVAIAAFIFMVLCFVSFEIADNKGIILPPGTTLIAIGLLMFGLCVIWIPKRVRYAYKRVASYLLRKPEN